MTDVRCQRTDDRGQRTEDRRQMTDDRIQTARSYGLKAQSEISARQNMRIKPRENTETIHSNYI